VTEQPFTSGTFLFAKGSVRKGLKVNPSLISVLSLSPSQQQNIRNFVSLFPRSVPLHCQLIAIFHLTRPVPFFFLSLKSPTFGLQHSVQDAIRSMFTPLAVSPSSTRNRRGDKAPRRRCGAPLATLLVPSCFHSSFCLIDDLHANCSVKPSVRGKFKPCSSTCDAPPHCDA
jgi:hypothetical protein